MDALRELETVTGAFAAELRGADPAARLGVVQWSVAELAAHLGEIHRWAAVNAISDHRNPRGNVTELDVEPSAWYDESRRQMLDTFHSLDPDAPCYTLSRDDRTVRFWHRRQLHESLVHLWDLRSRVPNVEPPDEVDADVWADSIDELFGVFLSRMPVAERGDLGGTLRLTATDARFDRTFTTDWSEAQDQATATVAAPAARLALFAWGRVDVDADHVTGDAAVVERFRRARFRP